GKLTSILFISGALAIHPCAFPCISPSSCWTTASFRSRAKGVLASSLKLQELVKSEIFSTIEKVKIFDTMDYLAAQVPSEELAAAIAAQKK
ncbi:MAG: hypothetical protein ABIE14_05175, partial [Patescibacteria group bacterium]